MHRELWITFYCLKIITEASKNIEPTHVPTAVPCSLESTGLVPPTLLPTPLARSLPWGGCPPCAELPAGEGLWGEVGWLAP